jgi:hypothetical protein
LEKLLDWLQKYANLILVAITGVYVFFTYRILKWSTVQAREALQPKLDIALNDVPEMPTFKTYRIRNVGQYSVVLLDVRMTVSARGRHVHYDQIASEILLPPVESGFVSGQVDFRKDIAVSAANLGDFAYWLTVTASDSTKRFAYTYHHAPLWGTSLRRGQPWRVWFTRTFAPVKWRYYRIKHWVQGVIDEVTKVP